MRHQIVTTCSCMNVRFYLTPFSGKYRFSGMDTTEKQFTEHESNYPSDAGKALSDLGASKGGEARALKLSPERRREIARAAVAARWAKAGKNPIPQATHAGQLKIGDISIPCAVLDNGTRLLTQWGFYRAIGRSGRPAAGWGSDVEKVAPF